MTDGLYDQAKRRITNFEYVAQSIILKAYLKKCLLFIHIQSAYNQRLSNSYQLAFVQY